MRVFTPCLLITDDDRDFRETVAGMLNERGFETLQAADGEEALDVVARQEVHLLLLDMQMPRLSGLDTIERLHERDQGGIWRPTTVGLVPLPWILLSGALDEQIISRARAASAFSVLPKPVRLPALTGAVTGALQQAYDWRAA